MPRECKMNSTLLPATNAGKIDPYPRAPNILHRLWLYVFRCRFLAIHVLGGIRLIALLRRVTSITPPICMAAKHIHCAYSAFPIL